MELIRSDKRWEGRNSTRRLIEEIGSRDPKHPTPVDLEFWVSCQATYFWRPPDPVVRPTAVASHAIGCTPLSLRIMAGGTLSVPLLLYKTRWITMRRDLVWTVGRETDVTGFACS